jgi:putative FmdB family regulatory protein
MPIYEYACGNCGNRFEEWQKMSDPPVRVCPKCKSKKVEKLISQTSFSLKGGGWYSDLYAGPKPGAKGGDSGDKGDKGGDKPSGGDSSASSSSDAKDSGTKETKVADKPAAKGSTKKAKAGGAS